MSLGGLLFQKKKFNITIIDKIQIAMKNRKINHLIMNFVSSQKYDLPISCDKKVNCKIQILVNNT